MRAAHRTGPGRRRAMVGVGVVISAGLLAGCQSSNQTKVQQQVNDARASAKVRALRADSAAMSKAQAWSEHMARTGVLEHTGGGTRVDPTGLSGWCSVGENVGYGPSTYAVHDAFLRSAPHRKNMLRSDFDRIGTGVAVRGKTVWITEIFLRSC